MMAKAQVASPDAVMVATVVALQGKAFARDKAGNLRALKVGDVVHENEELVCSTGSQVELLSNGVHQTFTNVDAVNTSADLFETAQAPFADNLQQPVAAHSSVHAMSISGDLTEQLENTAAGSKCGEANEPHDFVRLSRIVESVSPLDFVFSVPSHAAQDEILHTAEPVAGEPTVATPSAVYAPLLVVNNTPTSAMFNTQWSDTLIINQGATPNMAGRIYSTETEGWTRVDTPDVSPGSPNVYEVWYSGQSGQQSGDAGFNTVYAAPGNSTFFLELNDNPGGGSAQTIGITRAVATQVGQAYELSFDYAGRPGFGHNIVPIRIEVDGVTRATYRHTSGAAANDWQNLKFTFEGDGASHSIAVLTDPSVYVFGGRGAMITDISLYSMQGATAGNALGGTKTDIALGPHVNGSLVNASGSESLSFQFDHLPANAQIVSGAHTYTEVGGVITIAAADLPTAMLRIDSSYVGELDVNVTAIASSGSGGATASSSPQVLEFRVLHTAYSITEVDLTDASNVVDGTVAFYGTTGNDAALFGEQHRNVVYGLAGNDTINAREGNDVIVGGVGNDTLTGGTGEDTFVWSLADRGLVGAAANDVIVDFDATTTLGASDVLDLSNLLVGATYTGAGANLTNYLHFEVLGANTILHISTTGDFAGGFDSAKDDQTITLSNVDLPGALGLGFGASDAAIIDDLLAKNKLIHVGTANALDDVLTGTAGDNTMNGFGGDDTLDGQAGNDILSGGSGNDTLTGGVGEDTFKWSLSDRGNTGAPANDVITDFNATTTVGASDVLDLRDLLVGEYGTGAGANLHHYLHFEVSGANTLVHVSSTGAYSAANAGFSASKDDQIITLANINLSLELGLGMGAGDTAIINDLLAKHKLVTD
jgi:Ca2+-binding RTX toxin-like protein